MKRRFSLFTYPVMDMKAAEAELNRRAAAGWRLERVWLDGLASFVPVSYRKFLIKSILFRNISKIFKDFIIFTPIFFNFNL